MNKLTKFALFYTIVHMKRQFSFAAKEIQKVRGGYGGELLKKAKARTRGRPLSTRQPMHLVLRSSKAKGSWSFQNPRNARKVAGLVRRFSKKYGIQVLHGANVGNHLHLMIRLRNRHTYPAFIRGLTGSIAMSVTDTNKWRRQGIIRNDMPKANDDSKKQNLKFWDYRPFTRVIEGGRKEFLMVSDYIMINRLEGRGLPRAKAEIFIRAQRNSTSSAS